MVKIHHRSSASTSTSPDEEEKTSVIPSERLGEPGFRGIWCSAAFKDGAYGVLLGRTFGESSSFTIFFPECKFAAARERLRSMPEDYQKVFAEAIERLPEFKRSHLRLQ
jgi:hypothetical protein